MLACGCEMACRSLQSFLSLPLLQETTPERVEQESPYMLFYELQDIDQLAGRFRAQDRQANMDTGPTDDDKEFEETLKTIKKSCAIQ